MKLQKTVLAAAVLSAVLLAGCGVVPASQSAPPPMTNPAAAPAQDASGTVQDPAGNSSASTAQPPAVNPAQQPTGHHSDHHGTAGGGTIGTASVALSKQDAVDIALQHARVAQSDTVFLQAEGDRDNGRYLYEVEFYVGPTEYKYEIDANTGEILHFETETD